MGEELGMSNSFIPENLHQDKSDFNRDAERAPMMWNVSLNAGMLRVTLIDGDCFNYMSFI